MGLESAPTRGITVEPRSLVSAGDTNLVTPTAVEALTDAFRKGAITTSDIALRQQQKQKNQIDIEAAQREQDFQNDPMIQEVRKTVAIAAGAKAKSDTERAKREADLAPLLETAERARTIRAIDADRTLGESEKMAVKFQAAGVELPKTPEGFVDVAAARQSEDEINEWARSVIHDAEVAKSVKFEKRKAANGSVQVAPFSETLGRFLTDTEFTSIKSKEGQPQTFNAWRKAGRVVADAPPVAQLSPEEAAMHRANLVNSGQIAPEDGLSDSAVSELVQRRTTPKVDIFSTAAPGLAQRRTTPKVDIFSTAAPDRTIEEAPDKVVVEKPIPGEGVRELALARQAVGIGERLKQRYEDLLKSEPNLVGFLQGRVASWASTRQWNEKVAAFERDSTAILAPLAKGIFNETGVLSDKDIARYQSVIPDIRDNPKVGVQKANDLLGEVFESFANKVESWSQAGYNAGGFADLAETNRAKLKQLRSETGAAQPVPATANKPVTLSSGRKIVRGSDGKLYEVQ